MIRLFSMVLVLALAAVAAAPLCVGTAHLTGCRHDSEVRSAPVKTAPLLSLGAVSIACPSAALRFATLPSSAMASPAPRPVPTLTLLI